MVTGTGTAEAVGEVEGIQEIYPVDRIGIESLSHIVRRGLQPLNPS